MMRTLEREQWLPIPVEEAWHFFSSPVNLSKITPGNMGFRIRQPFDNAPINAGQRITYTVKPLFGIPLTWITCIAEAEEPHRFVDVQIKGPHKHWWHEHTFTAKDGGTLMRDNVEYEMPLGLVGDLAHAWLVGDRLKRIFDFRSRTMAHLFPVNPAPRMA